MYTMKFPYQSHNPHTGVASYEIADTAIILEFSDGKSRYLYNDEAPGRAHVEAMKRLAVAGKGLTTYVNQHVRDHYAGKLPVAEGVLQEKAMPQNVARSKPSYSGLPFAYVGTFGVIRRSTNSRMSSSTACPARLRKPLRAVSPTPRSSAVWYAFEIAPAANAPRT